MTADPKQPIWQMVATCVSECGGRATLTQIADYLVAHGRLATNARPDATCICVNDNSRVHFAGGKEVRRSDSGNRYDLLYKLHDKS